MSVEEDSRQEWTFTLYDFDNGKVTREVSTCLASCHGPRPGAQAPAAPQEGWVGARRSGASQRTEGRPRAARRVGRGDRAQGQSGPPAPSWALLPRGGQQAGQTSPPRGPVLLPALHGPELRGGRGAGQATSPLSPCVQELGGWAHKGLCPPLQGRAPPARGPCGGPARGLVSARSSPSPSAGPRLPSAPLPHPSPPFLPACVCTLSTYCVHLQ